MNNAYEKMRYLKAPNPLLPLLAHWGTFTRFLEIAEDGFAHRQVDAFQNGNFLRYDRENWSDESGMLAEANLKRLEQLRGRCHGTYSVETIWAGEFNATWEAARTAPNQPQNYNAEKFASVPGNLPMTAEQLRRLPPWIAKLWRKSSEN